MSNIFYIIYDHVFLEMKSATISFLNYFSVQGNHPLYIMINRAPIKKAR